MKKNLLHILFILLVAIALVFGYLIYQRSLSETPNSGTTESETSLKDSVTNEQIPPPPPPPVGETSQEVAENRVSRDSLLAFLWDVATDEEKKRYFELVKSEAKYVNLLDINGCNPEPVVIGAKYGESITVKNSDTIAHTLEYGDGVLTISPGNEENFVLSDLVEIGERSETFGKYICDDVPAGMFFISTDS